MMKASEAACRTSEVRARLVEERFGHILENMDRRIREAVENGETQTEVLLPDSVAGLVRNDRVLLLWYLSDLMGYQCKVSSYYDHKHRGNLTTILWRDA